MDTLIIQSLQMFLYTLAALLIALLLFKRIRRALCKPNYHAQTVWITGASSGIGEYLAYEFSRCGASLILSARNLQELERVKQKCARPDQVQVIRLDMADFDAVKSVTEEVISKLEKDNKRLDVVVQNAGVSMRCAMEDYDFQNHLSMFNVNVNGPYRHIQCFMRHMMKNKCGHIVGVSSAAGKIATTYRTSYAGSKHAFIGIMDSLRSEMHPYGISVTNIMPGYVATSISENAYGSGAGEKFGVTDKNIAAGQDPTEFASIAVKAIFLKENEAVISHQLKVPLAIFLRNLCPDVLFWGLRMNGKNQAKSDPKKGN